MIGIIFIGDLKYCPYIEKYIQVFNENRANYEVVFWNRAGESLSLPSNFISYNKYSMLNRHPIRKIYDFWGFKVWLERLIAEKRYEKLVILSTLSGVLLYRTLLAKFKGKYIFDIRDYSYENVAPIYKIEEKLIRNSYFTCISSQGFKEFLPRDYDYVIAHNFSYTDLKASRKLNLRKRKPTLNIVYNGAIKYFNHQSEIIKRVQNDSRFNLIFHGNGPDLDLFKEFCEARQIKNVIFTGEYKNSDKPRLLEDADILDNSYGATKANDIKYAISNKFYDGLIYGIPQLVEEDTYKCSLAERLEIGKGLNVYNSDFADKLYDYYLNIDEAKFNSICHDTLEVILAEDKNYLEKIKDFARD